jgi:lipoate-protein ligase A
MSEAGRSSPAFTGRSWQLWLDLGPRPGPWNMAIDQALLGRAARGEYWLRLYRWDPACLSFGRHEAALRRYDRERIAALSLAVVRRPTGGRAVWHAGEVTYALAMPAPAVDGIRAVCLEIHHMLRDALRALGVEATLAPHAATPPLDAGACFAGPAGGEVLVAGRKAVGSAQVREAGALLQHGSILLDDDQEQVRAVTRGDAPDDHSGPLTRVAGRALAPDRVARAIADAATARWGGHWSSLDAAPELLADAREYLPRFTADAWTWRA